MRIRASATAGDVAGPSPRGRRRVEGGTQLATSKSPGDFTRPEHLLGEHVGPDEKEE
jgi:hypothetical protein